MFSGVTGLSDCRCINLGAGTGQDIATIGFGNPKMVPDCWDCQPETGQLPYKAWVEVSPRT